MRGEKMRRLKHINLEDNLAQMFLICQGLYAIATGFLLFNIDNKYTYNSVYNLMANMMSLDAWALLLMISGLLMIVAGFQVGRLKALTMAISGSIGSALMILYGIASLEVQFSYAVGVRYIVVGVFMLIIAYLGIRTLWIGRRISDDKRK